MQIATIFTRASTLYIIKVWDTRLENSELGAISLILFLFTDPWSQTQQLDHM